MMSCSSEKQRHGLDYDSGRLFITPCQIWRMLHQSKFWFACLAAFPCGLCSSALKFWQLYLDEDGVQAKAMDRNAYSSLTFLVVFLMGFRVQAAYRKFWNGLDFTYAMVGDLWDSASSLFAFTIGAKAAPEKIKAFQHTLIRLYSIQGALMFGELEKRTTKSVMDAYDMELLDASGLDDDCLADLKEAECKSETNFQWIQQLIVEANLEGVFSVAPPILGRAFHDLGNSMQKFHDAEKTADVAFPFPYTIALQALLYIHWVLTFYAATGWSDYVLACGAFTFATIFCLWYFVGIALEMDRPFHNFTNSVDKHYIQREFNERLRTLLRVVEGKRNPRLRAGYRQDVSESPIASHVRDKTFAEVMAQTSRSGMLSKKFGTSASSADVTSTNSNKVVPEEAKHAGPMELPQQQQQTASTPGIATSPKQVTAITKDVVPEELRPAGPIHPPQKQGQQAQNVVGDNGEKEFAEALEALEEMIGKAGDKEK